MTPAERLSRTWLDVRELPLWGVATWCLAVLVFVYGQDAGHGFVKDDFSWIAHSTFRSASDVATVMIAAPSGFYRPLVSLSFGANRVVCGLGPRCYGLTNLLLALACAAAIFRLARALGLPAAGALLAGAVWIFNWHGIEMSVLWISGRTALVAVLCATLAAAAFVRRRPWQAAGWCFAAMLAKEEAFLVPAALIAWSVMDAWLDGRRAPPRPTVMFAGGSAVLTIAYLALRSRAGAFTPATAPPFYQMQFTLGRLIENVPASFDRTATFSAVVAIVFLVMTRPVTRQVTPVARRVCAFAAVWWVATLALTVFLPVRSSLYACLPSVGVALALAALVVDVWPSVPVARQRYAIAAALLGPIALGPILAARNQNGVRGADLSSATIAALRRVAAERGDGASVLLRDDRSARPSLDDAFGTLVQDAADLMVSPPVTVWIDPAPSDAALAGIHRPSHFDVVLALRGGAIVTER